MQTYLLPHKKYKSVAAINFVCSPPPPLALKKYESVAAIFFSGHIVSLTITHAMCAHCICL